MLKKLVDFNPHVVIVFDRLLADIAQKYLKARKGKANIIILTDSPDVIYNFALNIDYMHIPRLLKALIKYIYLWRQIRIYKKMAETATHIILPTKEDRASLLSLMPQAKNKSYVMQLLPFKKVSSRPIKRIKKIFFAGACNYPPNKEAVYIIEEKIAPFLPDKEFYIVGLGCSKRSYNNFHCLGEVSNKELTRLLESSDVCIAPLMHGTGLKSKVLEYLRYGKPVIGTHIAFQGFAAKNYFNAIIEDDPEKFAEHIKRLDSNPALISKIQRNLPTILNKFSKKKLEKEFARLCRNLV
jgi:glycosyltransferase involved in cell wall biosynthesis